jgi:ribonuclease BN (tRNA processing enzyme)
MKIQILGSGDAFGSGGRFNTCFHVEARDGAFLIDCGTSAMIALRRFGLDPNAIRTVFVSHLHGDHFGGLPFLILDAQLYSRRETPLTIAGPPGLETRLMQAMEVFFPGSSGVRRRFDTEIVELEAGTPKVVGGVTVTPFEVSHPCGAPPFALRLDCDGKVLAYTGDTEWTDALIEAGRGADLLIAEALFFDKKVKGHLDYTTLRTHLAEIAAGRVLLTHLGPEMLGRLPELDYEVAEDGLIVQL